jgi:cysteine synthase
MALCSTGARRKGRREDTRSTRSSRGCTFFPPSTRNPAHSLTALPRALSGINRLTKNFELALPIVDDAFRVSDAEAVAMARHLVARDGLFLGSSSACNLVACVRLVQAMGWQGSGNRVVTILCDSGSRHYSKFW